MSSIQNVSGISFKGNYIIPFDQVKDSATMRAIGAETSKYVDQRDMMQNKSGIVVKIDDDKRAKEYEAIIAKYGVNIQKYDGPFKQTNPDLDSYAFMVSKLYPEEVAQQKFAAYKTMNEQEKGKAYLETYKEFKSRKHSVENQTNTAAPKLKPTNKPIIKYTTKDGEKMMAREVMLENGYTCMAVSNEKNPDQATLMNKDKFKEFFVESARQVPSPTSFTGKESKKAVGEFAGKNFEVECSEGLTNRSLSGAVDNLNFNIKHNGKFFKSDTLTGNIGDKELNLKVKDGFAKNTITGTLGDEPIDLKVSDSWSGYRIKGQFKNRDIDIKLHSKMVGYSLESDNMSLRIKSKTLFGNDVKVNGTYNDDPDLIPILMDIVYSLNNEELMVMAAATAV